jgi:hypothetical protein
VECEPSRVFQAGAGCRIDHRSMRQFRITLRDEVSLEVAVMIRNRFPSGAISQLMGPVRMPVSTMSVSNRGCGVPAWKVGVVVHTKIFGARSVCRREKRNRSSRRQGELLPDNSERRFSCRRGAGAAAPVRPGSLPGRASPVREQRAFPPATRTRRRGHRCRRSRLLRGSSGRHTC